MSLFSALTSRMGLSTGAAITGIADAGFVYSGYKNNMEKGHGTAYSLSESIGSTILMNEFMLPTIALSLAPMLPLLHQQINKSIGNLEKKMTPMSAYNSIPDSQQAQTSRQRGLQAIRQARMQAQNVLGNEAGIYSPRFR